MDINEWLAVSELGTKLAVALLQARAESKGRTEITSNDIEAIKIDLDKVLRSGRTAGQLRERLKEIAAQS